MISLELAVRIVVYLVIGAAVFGLLYALLMLVARIFPGEGSQWFIKIGQLILAILAILVLIGLLLSLVTGQPLFRP